MNPYITNDETEIDLLDLGKYLLRRIVWILLVGAVIAIGAGAYAHFTRKMPEAENAVVESESETETEAETETETELVLDFDPEQYIRELDMYQEQSEMLDTSDDSLRLLIRKQESYMRDSLYMKLNPFHVWKAQALYQIVSLDPDYPAYQVRELYKYEIAQGDYLAELAKKRGTKIAYLKELAGSWGTGSATGVGGTTTDVVLHEEDEDERTTSELLLVQGMGNTQQEAQELLHAAMEEIEASFERYNWEYPHTLKLMSEFCAVTVDAGIRNTQKDYAAHTQALMAQVKDNKDKETWLVKPKSESELREIRESELESEREARKQLEEQKAAEQEAQKAAQTESETERKPVEPPRKRMVKFALIGFIIGAFLMCLVFVIRYMLNDLLVSYKDLERKGFALKDLGSNSEYGAAMAAASIRSFVGTNKRLFITGMAQLDAYKNACGKLKAELMEFELVCVPNVLVDPKAREQLLGCDAVVLLEQKGVSRYSLMRDEVTFLYHTGKEIIGIVII